MQFLGIFFDRLRVQRMYDRAISASHDRGISLDWERFHAEHNTTGQSNRAEPSPMDDALKIGPVQPCMATSRCRLRFA